MTKRPHPSDKLAKMNIRLPLNIRKKIQKIAKEEGRTMNSQVVQFLKKQLAA